MQLSQPLRFKRHNRRRDRLRHREIARVDNAESAAAAWHFPFVGGRGAVDEGAFSLEHAVGVRYGLGGDITGEDKGIDFG